MIISIECNSKIMSLKETKYNLGTVEITIYRTTEAQFTIVDFN